MKFCHAVVACAFMASAIPGHANLIITPTFDSSLGGQPERDAVDAAISVYENTFSNNINVQIYFQAFTANSGLGQSDVGRVYLPSYRSYYDNLVATNANPTAIASLIAKGGNGDSNGGIDPVLGAATILVKSADLRAVGVAAATPLCFVTAGDTAPGTNAPNHCASTGTNPVDGIITLNTNITTPPGVATLYFLQSVVQHEIDEVLGLGSALPGTNAGAGVAVTNTRVAPEDLWRFDSAGNRVFNVSNCGTPGRAFFSADGSGTGQEFNNVCNGADFGDWKNTSAAAQVQDAFATAGATPSLGANEISALTAIGYTLAAPEPGTSTLLLASFAVLGALRRRRG